MSFNFISKKMQSTKSNPYFFSSEYISPTLCYELNKKIFKPLKTPNKFRNTLCDHPASLRTRSARPISRNSTPCRLRFREISWPNPLTTPTSTHSANPSTDFRPALYYHRHEIPGQYAEGARGKSAQTLSARVVLSAIMKGESDSRLPFDAKTTQETTALVRVRKRQGRHVGSRAKERENSIRCDVSYAENLAAISPRFIRENGGFI